MAVDELGARHVRAVGIFDDELRVLRTPNAVETTSDKPNWQLVDYCIDSLLEVGVNPMFTTCFTPTVLASRESRLFTTGANASPPKDWNKWSNLISSTLQHFIWRYGKARVREWYCEAWNEPNLQPFWNGTKEEFFHLWKVTFQAVKSVDHECRIGGPSTARAEWIEEFINWGRKNACEPDFIVGHIYNNDSESNPLSPFEGPQEDKENKTPNFGDAVIRGTRQLLNSLNFKGELQWNEWGRSWYPNYPARETANEAAFVAKSMAGISNFVDHLAPWCLSDIYDQCGYSDKTFTGNYGLINLQGLRKPAYNAYRLLRRLGKTRIPANTDADSKCRGAIVAPREDGGFDILVYLYVHSDEQPSGEVDVAVNLPEGFVPRKIEAVAVDREENNILDQWRRLGSPEYLTLQQTRILKQANQRLAPSQRQVKVQENQLRFSMHEGSILLVSVF